MSGETDIAESRITIVIGRESLTEAGVMTSRYANEARLTGSSYARTSPVFVLQQSPVTRDGNDPAILLGLLPGEETLAPARPGTLVIGF